MHRVGPYAVERLLGQGGMGVVYLARSPGGRRVAVKVVHQNIARQPEFRQRFAAEIDVVRRVGGFHTAAIVDADPQADPPWFATEYIPGPTLADSLAQHGPMRAPALRALGAAVAEALTAIHRCGVVHRDLKPGNIIMTEDGPRVMDFGIARVLDESRLTSSGFVVGTAGYLSPEQSLGLDVTGASDVFALGAVLVTAAGGAAFHGQGHAALAYQAVHEPADVSAVPDELRDLVRSCLEKEPLSRPSPQAVVSRLTEPAGPGATVLNVTAPSPAQGSRQKWRAASDWASRGRPKPLAVADGIRTLRVDEGGITYASLSAVEGPFGWDSIFDVESEAGRTNWFIKINIGISQRQCFIVAPDEETLSQWVAQFQLLVETYLPS
ncbi:serine/threonine protein kinase [Streptomyces sp. NBC_00444]